MDVRRCSPRRTPFPLADLCHILPCVVQHLSMKEKMAFASSCRAVRDAVNPLWFPGKMFTCRIQGRQYLQQHIAWLQKVAGEVAVACHHSPNGMPRSLESFADRIVLLVYASQDPTLPDIRLFSRLTGLVLHGKQLCEGIGRIVSLPTTLLFLDLANCGLTACPLQLGALSQLAHLSLSGNRITGGLQHLPSSLQHLDLRSCNLTATPPELSALSQLTRLELSGNPIARGFQHVPSALQDLYLGRCNLTIIPPELGALSQLTRLVLSNNGIDSGFERLPRGLQHLNLTTCQLRSLPAVLTALTQLSHLDVSGNNLSTAVWHLPRQLLSLYVSYCKLAEVPMEFFRLSRLQHLYISGNPLTCPCDNVPRQLQALRLQDCSFYRVPVGLSQLTQLQKLDLSRNHIPHGSATWRNLPQQLTMLRLESCQMPALPFLRLPQLHTLMFSHNYLTRPAGFKKLPSALRHLDLTSSLHFPCLPRAMSQLTQLRSLFLGGEGKVLRGFEHLPASLQVVDLSGCGHAVTPPALARTGVIVHL